MIRFDLPPDATAADRWALETLVDLARLLPCENVEGESVALGIGGGDGFTIRDGSVLTGRTTLARVVAVAGAGAEQGSVAEDRHGRVPPTEHPLVQEGQERSPAVQRLAIELRAAVVAAAGRRPVRCVSPWPEGRRWAMAMTHDVDVVSGWPVFTAARLAELVRKGRLTDALTVAGAAMAEMGSSPATAALRRVLEVERVHGIPSTWYVLVGDPSLARWWQGDVTYRVESRVARGLLDEISSAGHEIGLHGSMRTFTAPERFAEERGRLARVIGSEPRGIRQHFLKMRPGATQRAMVAAGFEYDATFGFSDRNGFRLGVADVVGGWDRAADRPLALTQVPMHWMDRALSKYQGIEDPSRLVADGLALAEAVRKVDGLWVGLWHPNLSTPLGYPGAEAAFRMLNAELLRHAPWPARMSDVVEWRRIRRSARIRRVAPDGRVELASGGAQAWDVVVEDGQGRQVA